MLRRTKYPPLGEGTVFMSLGWETVITMRAEQRVFFLLGFLFLYILSLTVNVKNKSLRELSMGKIKLAV